MSPNLGISNERDYATYRAKQAALKSPLLFVIITQKNLPQVIITEMVNHQRDDEYLFGYTV